LNWLRGASVTGFAGIPPLRELEPGIFLIRPLLDATHDQVQDFLKARGYQWREDSSNRSPQYLRNRIRYELVPLLAELGGGENRLAQQTLLAAQIWRDDLKLLEIDTKEALKTLILCNEASLLVLDGIKFCALPLALQRRVLR